MRAVQKEKFQERMRELGQGEDSIRKLIQNLDAKKDNALQTTFKMVAKHFSDVFKTIVPGGEGRLIMKTKDVQEGENEDGAGSSRRSTREYTGIGVEVRFAAGTNVQKMRELSGGQKVLDRDFSLRAWPNACFLDACLFFWI
jgi:structural maintenance of chromosome 3 (chondroitin sulfate proteoglycan 6)